MEMRIQATKKLLYASVAGALDLPRALVLYDQLIETWRAGTAEAILLDCRQLRGTLSDLQRYEIGVKVAASFTAMREWGGPLPRMAMVAHPPLIEPRRFIQTVAGNRGALLQAFESLDEAAASLELEPALVQRLAAMLEPASEPPAA
jgi:hypothetical protein